MILEGKGEQSPMALPLPGRASGVIMVHDGMVDSHQISWCLDR